MTYQEYFKKVLKNKRNRIEKITMTLIKKVAHYFDDENDFNDIECVINDLKDNDIRGAVVLISNLDTIVRDAVINILEELI